MERVAYITKSHDYTENTPCADPKTCTIKSHWSEDGFEFKTKAQAAKSLDMHDAPAVQIVKVVTSYETVEILVPGE